MHVDAYGLETCTEKQVTNYSLYYKLYCKSLNRAIFILKLHDRQGFALHVYRYANYVATFFQSKHAEELSAERLLNEKEKKQLESKIQKEKMDLELELNRSLESEMQRMKYELKVSEVGKKINWICGVFVLLCQQLAYDRRN